MNESIGSIRPETMRWLLEEGNPSVRYFALRDLQGKGSDDPELVDARRAIMAKGVVPRILAKQDAGGFWGDPERFYQDKYGGAAWQGLLLPQPMAGGSDERIKKACEFLLARSQDREGGGFSVEGTEKNGGRHSMAVPCLTGNMVFAFIRLGYLGDARLERAIDRLCGDLRTDDGETEPPPVWPYDKFEPCYGRHSCFMGVVKALKGLAEIPKGSRTPKVNEAIARAADFLLLHHIYKNSHDLSKISKPGWLRFGFPLMYQDDALEIFGLLAGLECKDARMEGAADLIRSKQGKDGTWILANTFNGQFQEDIEEKGKPSKWITLNALRALKGYIG
jgi:hypothetical protein